ncbi:hypothetical protein [Fodinicola feengrottensis]
MALNATNPIRYVVPGILVGVPNRAVMVAILAASCAILAMTLRSGHDGLAIALPVAVGVGLLAGIVHAAIIVVLTGAVPVAVAQFIISLVCASLGALVTLVRPMRAAVAVVLSAAVVVLVSELFGVATSFLAAMMVMNEVAVPHATQLILGLSMAVGGLATVFAVAGSVWALVKSGAAVGREARAGLLTGVGFGALQVVPGVIALVAVFVPVDGETAGSLFPIASETAIVGIVCLVVAVIVGPLTALVASGGSS